MLHAPVWRHRLVVSFAKPGHRADRLRGQSGGSGHHLQLPIGSTLPAIRTSGASLNATGPLKNCAHLVDPADPVRFARSSATRRGLGLPGGSPISCRWRCRARQPSGGSPTTRRRSASPGRGLLIWTAKPLNVLLIGCSRHHLAWWCFIAQAPRWIVVLHPGWQHDHRGIDHHRDIAEGKPDTTGPGNLLRWLNDKVVFGRTGEAAPVIRTASSETTKAPGHEGRSPQAGPISSAAIIAVTTPWTLPTFGR